VAAAQVHSGGRGKAGGVKLAKTPAEAAEHASRILGMTIKGLVVSKVLVVPAADIASEAYVGLITDRETQRPVFMVSPAGGIDIEEVAAKTPEQIFRLAVDPRYGLLPHQALGLAFKLYSEFPKARAAAKIMEQLYGVFMANGASLVEINPLNRDSKGNVIALDAKFNFDSNALFRHPEIVALRDLDEEDPAEIEASKFDLAYIQLDGNIGCLVNGAGLAMATMDTIKLFGGEPANFLDVGGGATAEKVTEAFKIMLKNPEVKGILVNIFGGIMKCDTIADGVITACKAVNLTVPLVVRMKGTNEDLGKKMLADSGLPIISVDTMADAATKIVAAVQ